MRWPGVDHREATWAYLARERPEARGNAGLRSRVGDEAGCRELRDDATDVEDEATARQDGDRSSGQHERSDEVDRDDLVEHVGGNLVERAERHGAGAADDAVQATERLGCGDDERRRGSDVREVEHEAGVLADAEVVEPAPLAPGEGEARAAARECSREGTTDAARGTHEQNACPAERSCRCRGDAHRSSSSRISDPAAGVAALSSLRRTAISSSGGSAVGRSAC